jgi:glycosyltransferase involved in cell wall biosynthesis
VTERPPRIAIFGPNSVHTHRWADYVQAAGWDVTWIAYGAPDERALASIPTVRLELGGRFATLRTVADLIRFTFRLRRILRRVDPDVVQTHWFLGPAWLAACAGRQPVVATAWGSDVLLPFPGRRIAKVLTRALARRFAAVTYNSEALRDGLLRSGVPARKLHRVLLVVDPVHFRPGPRDPQLLATLGVPPGLPVILSPRGIAPVYAPEVVLDAFSRVSVELDCTLLIRVPPEAEAEWHTLRERLSPDAADRVIAFAGVESDVFADLLNSCDAIVSVSRSEGASVTVMEALMCERPVIVSDIPQNREWVQDDRFGAIVDVGDPVSLAAAIERVIRDPEGSAKRARAARSQLPPLDEVGPAEVIRLYDALRSDRGQGGHE